MTSDQQKRPNVLPFICIVLFFDAMGVGLIIPVLPELIAELSALPNSEGARIGGYLLFTFAAMQFLWAPILGGLSDRYGRRPVLLLALLGFSLDYFVMAAAPNLVWLFVARAISGVFGATFPAANACIADTTTPETRARSFGFTGAAVGAGFIFGPSLGGLLGEFGPRLPFLVAGVLTMVATIYGFFALPETLPPEKRRAFDIKRANPFGSLVSISKFPTVIPIIASVFFIHFASQSFVSIWSFFTIEVLDWSAMAIGLSAGLYGIMLVIVQGVLTGPVVQRLGEVKASVLSLAAGVIAYFGLSVASTAPMVIVFVIFGGLGGFTFPAMQSLMTQHMPEDAQGELQGALASSFSVTAVLGPLLMSQLFAAYSDQDGVYFPGAPFFAGGLMIAAAWLSFAVAMRRLKSSP